MHNSLAVTLSESVVELVAVRLGQEVTGERLTTILVNTLEDLSCSQIVSALRSQSRGSYSSLARVTNLVTSSVAQTGEERGELATSGGLGVLLEDNLVELAGVGDLWSIFVSNLPVHANRNWRFVLRESGCSSTA